MGYPDRARQECEAAIEFAKSLDHPYTLHNVTAYTLWFQCECSDLETVRTGLQTFITILTKQPTSVQDIFLFLRAWCQCQCGEIQLGIEQLTDYVLVRDLRRADSVYRNQALVLLAKAYGTLGQFELALSAWAEAFNFYCDREDWWNIAELFRLQGELLSGQGKPIAEVEGCFQKALAISRHQAAKSLELRAAMSLARLWAQQGKREEAYTLLAKVYHWFTEGFDTPALQEAKTLLEQL